MIQVNPTNGRGGDDATNLLEAVATAFARRDWVRMNAGEWFLPNVVVSRGVRIEGEGSECTTIQLTGAGVGVSLTGGTRGHFGGVRILPGPQTTIGFQLIQASHKSCSDVEVDGTLGTAGFTGVQLTDGPQFGSYYNHLVDVWAHNCSGPNFDLEGMQYHSGVAYCNANVFGNCLAQDGGSHGIKINGAEGNVWEGGDSEYNAGNGWDITNGAFTRVHGTWVEGNALPVNFNPSPIDGNIGIHFFPAAAAGAPGGLANLGAGSMLYQDATNPLYATTAWFVG